MNKILTILIIFILVSCSVSATATVTQTPEEFNEALDSSGIKGDVQGCDASCSYSGGILTLSAGAILSLDKMPKNTIVEANGAQLILPNNDIIIGGTLDTATQTLTNGELALSDDSNLDLTFDETTIHPVGEVTVFGTGTIKNGEISYLETAEINLPNLDDSISISNLYDFELLPDPLILDEDDRVAYSAASGYFISGTIDENTAIKTADGGTVYLSTDDKDGSFYFSGDLLTCSGNCNYDVHGTANIQLDGTTLNEEEEHEIRDKDKDLTRVVEVVYSIDSERTVSFNGGEQHSFEGQPLVSDGMLTFAKGNVKEYPQSVDGRYILSEYAPVQVLIDYEESVDVLAGNYVVINGDETRMIGTNYNVAFGDTRGISASNFFPFNYVYDSPMIDKETDNAQAFIVHMGDGDVFVSPEYVVVNKVGEEEKDYVQIINGVNLIDYRSNKDGSTGYDYTYNGCYTKVLSANVGVACGEVDTTMLDGGMINFVTEEGLYYEGEGPFSEAEIDQETEIGISMGTVMDIPAEGYESGDYPAYGTEDNDNIKEIQRIIGLTGSDVDGKYGSQTEAAVIAWQEDYNAQHGYQLGDAEYITPDGVWDDEDLRAFVIVSEGYTPASAVVQTQVQPEPVAEIVLFEHETWQYEDDTSEAIYPATKQGYELDTSKMYVLGYNGGRAAKLLAGQEASKYVGGHAGLMYFKDGNWYVAEQDGSSQMIRESDYSLFAGKLHDVYEVGIEDPDVIQEMVTYLESTAGRDYGPFTEHTFNDRSNPTDSCSGLVEATLIVGGIDDPVPNRVNYRTIEEEEGTQIGLMQRVFGGWIAPKFEATPDAVFLSEYLTPVEPVYYDESSIELPDESYAEYTVVTHDQATSSEADTIIVKSEADETEEAIVAADQV